MSIKERTREEQYSDEHSERVEIEVSRAVANLNLVADEPVIDEETDEPPVFSSTFLECDDVVDQFVREMYADNQRLSDYEGAERTYNVRLNDVTEKQIRVSWEIGSSSRWIQVTANDDISLSVVINVNHPFFKPYSNEDEFQVVLEKFVIAFVVAEEMAKLNSSSEGYILASAIRNNMNRYLGKLSED